MSEVSWFQFVCLTSVSLPCSINKPSINSTKRSHMCQRCAIPKWLGWGCFVIKDQKGELLLHPDAEVYHQETYTAKWGELSPLESSDETWVSAPELAVASAAAEGCCATAERGWSLDNGFQRGALPHEVVRFQVLPVARKLVCGIKTCRKETEAQRNVESESGIDGWQ